MAEEAGSQPSSLLLLPQPKEHPQTPQSIPEHLMYKNRLQEFAQRTNIPLPVYRTKNNGGPSEAPRFTSTVEVDGEVYTSMSTLSNKKAAEQDAAKHALEEISKKIKNCISNKTTEGGFPPIFQDKVFCKSILHEFAAKMNIEKPKYDTVRSEGLIPVFFSTLEFRGVKYVGEASVNKKEAEQLAARAAILSILATGEAMQLSEIIKSKARYISAVHERIHANANANTYVSTLQPNIGTALVPSATKGDSEGTCQAGEIEKVAALPLQDQSSKEVDNADQASNGIENVVVLPLVEKSSEVNMDPNPNNGIESVTSEGVQESEAVQGQSHILPKHEFRKPVPETYSEPVPLTIEFVSAIGEDCGGKRKRRRKKKADKKAKTELQSQICESDIQFQNELISQ